jgi:hypothetical protein
MLIRRIHVTGAGTVPRPRRAARRPRYQSPPASRGLPPGPASRTVKYDLRYSRTGPELGRESQCDCDLCDEDCVCDMLAARSVGDGV